MPYFNERPKHVTLLHKKWVHKSATEQRGLFFRLENLRTLKSESEGHSWVQWDVRGLSWEDEDRIWGHLTVGFYPPGVPAPPLSEFEYKGRRVPGG